MGLASALSTALTGLNAAETQIDVVGNNLANSQTVGFKASDTVFASQFLQTRSLGSAPTTDNGGTNPRQVGLGVQVAEITPDFTQGTIQASSSPSDLALQGEGFFMVEALTGERLYTRNGIFKTNSENQLVSITGNRLLGFAVDDTFQLQSTQVVPLTIPIGATAVAQATQNVFLEGTLTPTGDIADTAGVIESAVLSDGSIGRPDVTGLTFGVAPTPDETGTTPTSSAGGGLNAGSTYEYRFTFVDAFGSESLASGIRSVTLGGGDGTVTLDVLPSSPGAPAEYSQVNVYRRELGVETQFFRVGQAAEGSLNFVDAGLASGTQLDETTINGNYSYLVTFFDGVQQETRPSLLVGPQNIVDGRIHLQNLPTPTAGFTQVRIYRNLATDSNSFHLVETLNPGEDFTDNRTDVDIAANQLLDLDGPKVNPNSLLVDVLTRDGLNFENVFQEGALSFSARKGGRVLEEKQFTITASTTVQELVDFMEAAMGVQEGAADDPANPIPGSVNNIPGDTSSSLSTGGVVLSNGKLRFVSNNGVDNSLEIGLSAFQLTTPAQTVTAPNLGFDSVQSAQGQSIATDFLVFDSLGIPINVRVTAVLESRDSSRTVYRWFADSPENQPPGGVDISVGTGLIEFDGLGNLITSSNATVSIERRDVPSASPLDFDLDFSQLSGLAQDSPSMAATRQDGFPTGTLASFGIGEDGVIRGSFTNGVTRDLGQIRLARFTNPTGLEQRGLNQFAAGANSGLPVEGSPGEDGMAAILAGALELSNTDVGQNLVDLVLSTTMYRGNTRVISTAQQLVDEILNLRR